MVQLLWDTGGPPNPDSGSPRAQQVELSCGARVLPGLVERVSVCLSVSECAHVHSVPASVSAHVYTRVSTCLCPCTRVPSPCACVSVCAFVGVCTCWGLCRVSAGAERAALPARLWPPRSCINTGPSSPLKQGGPACGPEAGGKWWEGSGGLPSCQSYPLQTKSARSRVPRGWGSLGLSKASLPPSGLRPDLRSLQPWASLSQKVSAAARGLGPRGRVQLQDPRTSCSFSALTSLHGCP